MDSDSTCEFCGVETEDSNLCDPCVESLEQPFFTTITCHNCHRDYEIHIDYAGDLCEICPGCWSFPFPDAYEPILEQVCRTCGEAT